MHIPVQQLKPLDAVQLSVDEGKILVWLKRAAWEAQTDAREPIPYKTKVPEFFGGVRLYRMHAGGTPAGGLGALELFLKKLEYQGVIAKQGLYPLAGHGNTRFLSLTKAELDNLGVGREEEEE